MADSASAILLVRLQSTGSNTNLWGGYINDNLEILERGSKGYQAYTVTGDATVSQSNYSKTNDYAVAAIKLNGAPAAAWTHTLPSRQHFFYAWNNSGQSGTLKASGGTGVTLAAGQRALIYGDGTDYYNAAPTVFPAGANVTMGGALTVAGQISGVTAATSGTQAVNKTQMDAAIAAGAIPAATGAVKVDAAATPGYLYDVLTVSGSLVKTDNGDTMNIGFAFDEGNQVLLGGVLAI